MGEFKDHFSGVAGKYAEFRPSYPRALFEWLATVASRRGRVWDCATGNGQAASGLAEFFEEVLATQVGRGGAAFPTARKWETAMKSPNTPKYMFCNGEEGEPAIYKDRRILESDPHMVLEGMLVAGFVIGVDKGYVYVGGEHLSDGALARGFFVEPTVVGDLPASHRVFEDELFAPFTSIQPVESAPKDLTLVSVSSCVAGSNTRSASSDSTRSFSRPVKSWILRMGSFRSCEAA